MKCDACNEHQQQLLDNGDGSQVICYCIDNTETENVVDIPNATSMMMMTNAIPATVDDAITTTTQRRKRKFLTDKEFAKLGDDKVKRKISPVIKWTELTERRVYLVVNIFEMDVEIKGKKQRAYYAQLEDSEETMKNVWLTDIIRDELRKYSLDTEDVYIKPLGKTKSLSTGHEYNDFVIVRNNANSTHN